jgi:nucleoside-diphosphate-sugar epimerase
MGVIVIRPGDVYGPGSVPWVDRPIAMMKKGLFLLPGRGQGIMNHVHVDNLVDGIFRAIDQKAWGETFNLADGRRTTNLEYFSRLAEVAGLAPPRVIPAGLFRAIGAANRAVTRAGLKLVELDVDTVKYLERPGVYSIEKARTKLGFEPKIDLDEGMRRLRASAAGARQRPLTTP